MKKIIILVMATICFGGCGTGNHCIKIGGGYTYDDGQKIDGNLEYCFDQPASDANKTPVLKDGAGTKYMLLSEQDAHKLIAADPGDAKAASVLPFWDLKKRLAEKK